MRSNEVIVMMVTTFNNSAGSDRIVSWTNPSPGRYDIAVNSEYEMLSCSPMGTSAAASQAILLAWGSRVTSVQFLSNAGAAGNYGGAVALVLRKRRQ